MEADILLTSTPQPYLILSDPSKHGITQNVSTEAELLNKEHFNRLVEGFGFSRRFILTYQPAIVGVVVLVAVWRWYSAWARARRRSNRRRAGQRKSGSEETRDGKSNERIEETEGWTSSSSRSIREGSAIPPDAAKTSDEWSLLLALGESKKRSTRFRFHPIQWLKSALMYQPRPIPIVNKVLPENTTTLSVLALFGLNLFFLLYNVGWTDSTQDIVADRAGLLFVANLPWLYLLAAKNQPIKLLTGDSYENLNLLHRRIGEWMCFLAVVHLSGMLLGWYNFLRPMGYGLIRFLTIRHIMWGWGAWLAYELLYVTSLGSFREWWYEIFLGIHVILQVIGLVTLFLHHHFARPAVNASLLIFVLDRLFWRLRTKTMQVQADLQVMEDGETVLVSADWPVMSKWKSCWRGPSGWDLKFGWKPSEHVFITVPGMSRKHKYQFHPMTIASAAPGPEQKHAWFNLIIQAKGGFSRDLLHFAQIHSSATVRLDGPYGSLHALEMLQESDVAVIVAGGSGIAVAYPLIWSLLHQDSRSQDMEQSARTQQVCLIWVVQDASHITWLGLERLEELKALGLHIIIPPPSRKQGRPDVQGLLRDKIDDLSQPVTKKSKIGVIVSGPDGLNRAVHNTCARMVRQGRDVEVAIEKFGW